MTDQAHRQANGTFGIGNKASPYGRGAKKRRAELQAEHDEAERSREETALVTDLGRVPSHAEIVLVEQLSTLIVRGRRLRASGQGADAEMIARLVIRGLGKLGIRQGAAKPAISPLEYWKQKQAQAASVSADESASEQHDDESLIGDLPSIAGASS
jgi:hypothetical protein